MQLDMNKKLFSLFSLFFFLVISGNLCHGQKLNIKEIVGTVEISNPNIVDINSRLEINIERDFSFSIRPQEISTDSIFLNELVQYGKVLRIQETLLRTFSGNTKKDFFSIVNSSIDSLRGFDDAYKLLVDLTEEAFNEKKGEYYEDVLIKFGKEFSLRKPVQKKNASTDRYTVGIKAELKTKGQKPREIRVLGYNNIEESAFEPVEIWNITYSESELKAAREMVATARKTLSKVKDVVDQTIETIDVDGINKKIDEVRLKTGDKLQSVTSGLQENFDKLKTITKNKPIEEIGESLENTIITIKNHTESLQSTYARNLIHEDLLSSLVIMLKDAVGKVEKLNKDLILPTERMYFNAQSANVDNYFHGLDDAPTGYIDLKTSGNRSNFDELHIQLQIKKGNIKEPIIKKLVALKLLKVNWHLETNVGVILANSIQPNNELALTREFQFAPNVNFIFKRGSRKNDFINFIQPGIGISISTPDFDLNTSPDFSFGLVGTVLRDLISIGISYNTSIDNTFWFVGFSLPFTGIGLPLGNVKNEAVESY
tara:strand:+ start:8351 stop:9976 length:1626 start_codon:yes stop_codon:yes gene_type:complete